MTVPFLRFKLPNMKDTFIPDPGKTFFDIDLALAISSYFCRNIRSCIRWAGLIRLPDRLVMSPIPLIIVPGSTAIMS